MTKAWSVGVVVLVALGAAACGSESEASAASASVETEAEAVAAHEEPPAPADTPPEIARPYDESADAQADIDAAVASAAGDGKRVLLVFGANWCVWCRRLDWVLQNEPRVAAALRERWHLVHVDVGDRGTDTNRAVAARYGDPLSNGLPCLVVVDGNGEVVHVQETGSLEDGPRHDPERILAFLSRWSTAPGT